MCFADPLLPSDVAVSLSADKTTNLKTEDRITFTMTATNNGPQTLTYFSINGPEIFTEFNQPGVNWNDCAMLTDTGDTDFGPFWVLVWFERLSRVASDVTGPTREKCLPQTRTRR